MKKGVTVLALCATVFFGACSQERLIEREMLEVDENSKQKLSVEIKKDLFGLEIGDNQVVVHYLKDNIQPKEKVYIQRVLKSRYSFELKRIDKCNCDNMGVELWTPHFLNFNSRKVEDLIGPHDVDEDGLKDLN